MIANYITKQRRKTKGFTLVELILVIAIIGLITAVSIPIYTTEIAKSNITKMVNKLGSFKLPLVDSYTSAGSWPAALNGATAATTVSDSFFAPNAINFRYNKSASTAWWGYQLSTSYGSGWIFMVLIANNDGSYSLHCGSMDNTCTYGYCNSLQYFPSSCSEKNLSTTYSITTP